MTSNEFIERITEIANDATEKVLVKFNFKENGKTPSVILNVDIDDESESEAFATRNSINVIKEYYDEDDDYKSNILWAVGCWVGGMPWGTWSNNEEQFINMMFRDLIGNGCVDENLYKESYCKHLNLDYDKLRKEAEERVNHFLNDMTDFEEIA